MSVVPLRASSRISQSRSDGKENGMALIEFVFSGLFWIPLLLGTIILGLNLIRAIQVTQVCRDAGHMFSEGIDFSQTANQSLLIDLAQGLNMTATGGNGVIILSEVKYVTSTDCTAAGLQANTTSCPNMNQIVFTLRLVIGNSSLHASNFGTPNAGDMNSDGSIDPSVYLTDPSTVATGLSNLISLSSGQTSYMSEMWVTSPDIDNWAYLGSAGASARSIF